MSLPLTFVFKKQTSEKSTLGAGARFQIHRSTPATGAFSTRKRQLQRASYCEPAATSILQEVCVGSSGCRLPPGQLWSRSPQNAFDCPPRSLTTTSTSAASPYDPKNLADIEITSERRLVDLQNRFEEQFRPPLDTSGTLPLPRRAGLRPRSASKCLTIQANSITADSKVDMAAHHRRTTGEADISKGTGLNNFVSWKSSH